MSNPKMAVTFPRFEVRIGRLRLCWEFIGEGHINDYDPSNPKDEPLLRFYVDWRGRCWEPLEDGSYCTSLNVWTKRSDLAKYAAEILHSISPDGRKPEGYKTTLELWSWLGTDNPENLPNHQKEQSDE